MHGSEPVDLVARALERRRSQLTPEQEATRKAIDARNKRLQELALRPPNGVTFGAGKPPKAA